MTGAHEKSVHRLAERKGFRLDKVGKGHHRFYIIDLASGGRRRAFPNTNTHSHSNKPGSGSLHATVDLSNARRLKRTDDPRPRIVAGGLNWAGSGRLPRSWTVGLSKHRLGQCRCALRTCQCCFERTFHGLRSASS